VPDFPNLGNTHTRVRGASNLGNDSLTFDEGFSGFDESPLKPPTFFLYIVWASVTFGALIGIYGILRPSGFSSAQQYLIGGIGYILTAILPIVFLQISRSKHDAAKANYKERSYDFYGGEKLQKVMLRSVAVGLVSAFAPIWIFFSPLAEWFV
jgi:hypothetical protein